MSDNNAKNSVLPILCDWCGKTIPSINQSKTLVCEGCYSLLHKAGIKDEEIYGNLIAPSYRL